jgi:hypothetical protein
MDIPEYNEVDPFDIPAYTEAAVSMDIPEYTEMDPFDLPAYTETAVSVGIPEYTEMDPFDIPAYTETLPAPPRTDASNVLCAAAAAQEPSTAATPPSDASTTTEDIFENDRHVRIVHGNKRCEVVHDDTKPLYSTCIDSDSKPSTRESESEGQLWADDGNSTASSSSSLSAAPAENAAQSVLPAMDQSVRNRKNRIKTIARTIKFKRSKPNAKTCRRLESRQLLPPQSGPTAPIADPVEATPLSKSFLGVRTYPLAKNASDIGVEPLSQNEPIAEGPQHVTTVPAAQVSQPQHENEADGAVIPVAGDPTNLVSLLLWMLVQLAVLKMMPVSN